jgi:hypothetical protein
MSSRDKIHFEELLAVLLHQNCMHNNKHYVLEIMKHVPYDLCKQKIDLDNDVFNDDFFRKYFNLNGGASFNTVPEHVFKFSLVCKSYDVALSVYKGRRFYDIWITHIWSWCYYVDRNCGDSERDFADIIHEIELFRKVKRLRARKVRDDIMMISLGPENEKMLVDYFEGSIR